MRPDWRLFLVALLCLARMNARAQEQTATNSESSEAKMIQDLVDAGDQLARENLDPDFVRMLDQVDRQQVAEFLLDFTKRLDGPHVLDLAEIQNAANALAPLLEQREETLPYALWLKPRLEYFRAAEELRRAETPPSKPGQAPKPLPQPGPDLERKVWNKQLELSPRPKAAESLVPRLKAIFAEQKVPPELIWLAEVESSFDSRARSPSGAVGLFQLTPQTARSSGLSTFPWDERKQPEANARAAAAMLARLHRQFHDWPLALAAYNAGEGRVQSLLAKQKIKSFDAIAAKLPAETQMYVPRVEATLMHREGVSLSGLKSPGT